MIMKVKSITDIITNSSSEVLIIKTTRPAKDIEDELKAVYEQCHPDDRSGGMGGLIACYDATTEVFDFGWYWEDPMCEKEEYRHKPFIHLPEGIVVVEIDRELRHTRQHIKDHFQTIEGDKEVDKVNDEWILNYWTKELERLQSLMTSEEAIKEHWPRYEEGQNIINNIKKDDKDQK